MTAKERKLIGDAIGHLKSDDGWEKGIAILRKLENPNWKNKFEEMDTWERRTIAELGEDKVNG